MHLLVASTLAPRTCQSIPHAPFVNTPREQRGMYDDAGGNWLMRLPQVSSMFHIRLVEGFQAAQE